MAALKDFYIVDRSMPTAAKV